MKKVYHKLMKTYVLEPETPLEAVEHLFEFFQCDMWYAKGAEWKNEKEMIKYLNTHFKICIDSIKKMKTDKRDRKCIVCGKKTVHSVCSKKCGITKKKELHSLTD